MFNMKMSQKFRDQHSHINVFDVDGYEELKSFVREKMGDSIGAEGDFVTLLQSSKFNGEKENTNRTKNDAHKLTKYFEYYLKTVVIDKKAFDVVINIRREDSGTKYVYEVKLNKAKESSQLAPQIAKFYNDRRTKVENSPNLSELSSPDKVPQDISKVKGKVQNSSRNLTKKCFAEQSYLFSSLFSLIFYPETTI